MNLPALVMHGICALSVWSDVIVARLFLVVAGLITLTLALLAGCMLLSAHAERQGLYRALSALLLRGSGCCCGIGLGLLRCS
jgi:Na+/H+ antiporter NhaD/arsenite permease-like protein